jgi:predicted ATPase
MSTYPHPIISRIQVKNYRSLADIDLSLHPLTVLVGPNSSGKSNLVDVLRFVRDAIRRDLDAAILDRGGMSSIRRWSASGRPPDVQIHVFVVDESWSGEYGFILGSERDRGYQVKREKLKLKDGNGDAIDWETKDGRWARPPQLPEVMRRGMPTEWAASDLFLPKLAFLDGILEEMTQFLHNMSFYTIYPDVLREPQKPLYAHVLEERGFNLASVLRNIKEQDDHFAETAIRAALEKVVPGVDDFAVSQVGGYLVTRLHRRAADGTGPAFELASESDGTLRMLGILTALYQQPPRSLLAIEEPELTIHPGALGALCDALQEASLRSQVIITTHSPDLINRFSADNLVVVEKEDGVTKAGPVNENQRRAIAEKLFAPGELMLIDGLRR